MAATDQPVDNGDEIDPATGLRRRIAAGINYADPSAQAGAPSSGTPDPAPFTTQPVARSADPTSTQTPAPAPITPAAPVGNDAASTIDALYKQYNVSDGGQGSGFADRAYWLAHPSEILNGRLGRDLAGTGTDQPTGTPGTGPWSSSGAADRNAPAAATGAAATGGQLATSQGLSPASGGNDAFSQFLAQYQSQQAAQQAQKDQVRQYLMGQLKSASQPVNPNDPNIAAPLSAARDETARATDQERTALAERLYAQGGGLNSNALTQGIQQSSERNAGSLSNLRASLISNEYNARRTQMTQLLSQALASGNADAAQQIQVQMAALDAALKREGLGTNLAEFGAQLNQNAALAGLNG